MPAKKRKDRAPAKRASKNETEPVTAKSWPTSQPIRLALAVTIFSSAFLLFQVQPMVCKAVLPWFGGTPAVWTTSMFFFQVLLLLGYLYAHWSTRYLTAKWQVVLHLGLVVMAIAFLPVQPSEAWKPAGGEPYPAWHLLRLLTGTVGVPFFLLSTTAPLVQVWWHRLFGDAPYRLYAVSNAGSLLALVSYPFLIEPAIGVSSQIVVWSAAFFAVACSLAICCYFGARDSVKAAQPTGFDSSSEAPSRSQIITWLTLSACGSVLLLAMTNHITQNVAVVPFLWVAPLALYLLSFILSFSEVTYYRRWLFGGLMMVTLTGSAFLYSFDVVENVTFLLSLHLCALFAGCMVCHGELARMKPHAYFLTKYFVVISMGGAAGGFLVSVAAPYLFSNYYEYPLVLIACWGVLFTVTFRDRSSPLYRGRPVWAWGLGGLCFFAFLFCLRNAVIRDALISYVSRRSFYGVLSVRPYLDDEEGKRVQLVHGMISHGSQFLDEQRQFEPTSYYRLDSGLGCVMELAAGKPQKRVGMLGLGIGTIAAYSEAGDYFRVYEINKQVIDIATDPDIFTFWRLLEQRGAEAEMVVGDARVSLEAELQRGEPQNFDVLVLDVFSGDAIPVHLMTIQAFQTYFDHLAEQGLLAVHISNRYLDLLPVVRSTADHFNADVVFIAEPQSEWLILGSTEAIGQLVAAFPNKVKRVARPEKPRVWTDDYSDILSVLK